MNSEKRQPRAETDPMLKAIDKIAAHPRVPKAVGKTVLGLGSVRRTVMNFGDRVVDLSGKIRANAEELSQRSKVELDEARSKLASANAELDADQVLRQADKEIARQSVGVINEAEAIVSQEYGRIQADRPGIASHPDENQ